MWKLVNDKTVTKLINNNCQIVMILFLLVFYVEMFVTVVDHLPICPVFAVWSRDTVL